MVKYVFNMKIKTSMKIFKVIYLYSIFGQKLIGIDEMRVGKLGYTGNRYYKTNHDFFYKLLLMFVYSFFFKKNIII